MSITSLGLGGLEKASIPASNRFSSPTLPQLNPRFPAMDARLVAAARLPGLSMYGSPYTSPSFPGYLPYNPAAAAVAAATADPSSFYPPLGPGENADSWRASLTQAAAAAYYDPAIAAHYGYGYGPMGLSDGARRKNATRETTSTLKAWLNDHRRNPYPTKGEKIMLAIITKMTLTQVSTWFANARRRLKKENKMTWSPRNRCGEDDDDDDMGEDAPLNGETQSSRLSTPISPDLSQNGRISHPFDKPHLNGHSSGIDSNSDEGLNYSNIGGEVSRSILNKDSGDKSERKSPGLHPSGFAETQARIASSHFLRQHSHSSSSSPPPLTSLSSNLSNSSSAARPNIPFPQPIPQLPVVSPHPNLLHPGLTEQLGQSPSLSRLPPHLMAALIEQAQQFHYHPAIQGLTVNSFLNPVSGAPKTSSNTTTIESDALKFPKLSESVSSTSPTTPKPSSPTKSKIWSIADVAASSESSSKSKLEENHEPSSKTNEIPNIKMWMDAWQFKMNMSGNMSPQLANPHTSAPLIPPNRFPPFQGFPGLVGISETKKATKDEKLIAQDFGGRSSISPHHASPDLKDCNISDQMTSIKSSPGSSHHGDSSVENGDAK